MFCMPLHILHGPIRCIKVNMQEWTWKQVMHLYCWGSPPSLVSLNVMSLYCLVMLGLLGLAFIPFLSSNPRKLRALTDSWSLRLLTLFWQEIRSLLLHPVVLASVSLESLPLTWWIHIGLDTWASPWKSLSCCFDCKRRYILVYRLRSFVGII